MGQEILQYIQKLQPPIETTEEKGNKTSSPSVMIFFGEEGLQGHSTIEKTLQKQWWEENRPLLFTIARSKGESQGYYLEVPFESGAKRMDVLHQFLAPEILIKLKGILSRIVREIGDRSHSFEQNDIVEVTVVTSAYEMLNICISDLVLLVKELFGESFKAVKLQLAVTLLQGEMCHREYEWALAMAFLEELQQYQQLEASLKRRLPYLQGQGLSSPYLEVELVHQGPLFESLSFWGDVEETGRKVKLPIDTTYENLLSFGRIQHQKGEEFSGLLKEWEGSRKRDPLSFLAFQHCEIQKPFVPITLGAALAWIERLEVVTQEENPIDLDVVFEVCGLRNRNIGAELLDLESWEILHHLKSVLSKKLSYSDLCVMSFQEAEQAWFGNHLRDFFDGHIANSMEILKLGHVVQEKSAQRMESLLLEQRFAPLCLLGCSLEDIVKRWEIEKKRINQFLQQEKIELQKLYEGRVGDFAGLPSLWRSKYQGEEAKEHLLQVIYGKHCKIAWLEKYVEVQKKLLQQFLEMVQEMEKRQMFLSSMREQLVSAIELYKAKEEPYRYVNAIEYYGGWMKKYLLRQEESRGAHYYFEEEMLGAFSNFLPMGPEAVLHKILNLCEQSLQKEKGLWTTTVEEELLERANISTAYEEEVILAKAGLYHSLLQSLEEHSKVPVQFWHRGLHEIYRKHLLLGERESEFLTFAQALKGDTLITSSGGNKKFQNIERYTFLGGFVVQDLVCYPVMKKYYLLYVASGYPFHREERIREVGRRNIPNEQKMESWMGVDPTL